MFRSWGQLDLETVGAQWPEPATPPSVPPLGVPMTTEDRVALSMDLVRGRRDVYPKLWINATKGNKSYSPACGNEWVRGLCVSASPTPPARTARDRAKFTLHSTLKKQLTASAFMQLPEWQGVWQIFGRHPLGEPRYGRHGTPREAPSCVTTPWNRITIPPLVPCWTPRGTHPDDRPTAPSRMKRRDRPILVASGIRVSLVARCWRTRGIQPSALLRQSQDRLPSLSSSWPSSRVHGGRLRQRL
jgi:hypothetical protein